MGVKPVRHSEVLRRRNLMVATDTFAAKAFVVAAGAVAHVDHAAVRAAPSLWKPAPADTPAWLAGEGIAYHGD